MKIKIELNETDLELTPADARRLYDELHEIFGASQPVPWQPVPWQPVPWQPVPRQPSPSIPEGPGWPYPTITYQTRDLADTEWLPGLWISGVKL